MILQNIMQINIAQNTAFFIISVKYILQAYKFVH